MHDEGKGGPVGISQNAAASGNDRAALAAELLAAEQSRRPLAPLSERDPQFDIAAAYAVQAAGLALRRAAGARLVGRKIGLTNRAIQLQLGVDSPDYGYLLDTMIVTSGATLARSDFIAPRLEPEIAFVLGAPLRGPGVTLEDVLRATAGFRAALELIDSRIADWRIKLVDTVADNASSSRVILSDRIVGPDSIDLVAEMVSVRGGADSESESMRELGAGSGEAVLGHPAASVAWLANILGAYGDSLAAGDIVMPGAMCAAPWVEPHATYRAHFSTLGEVSVSFSA